ncbi:MAG TPA: hypothetical protein PKY96_01565 [Flavobacteriales bacterium]|nr:hypothetical protein [Flavobacteriales bacterium]
MARERLKKEELDRLLAELFGERRLLMYKLDRVRKAINELKGLRASKTANEEGPSADGEEPKRGPGRPRGSGVRRYRRKPGRRKKRAVVGGYRLNAWDTMVVDAINGAKRLLTKQELLEHSIAWAKKNEPKTSKANVEVKLTRTLQKLGGKRSVLGKHRSGMQRGLHYGVIDWFFHGKLRQEHKDKVRLHEK